jgi:short-subunit dehydrogenase
MNNKELNTVTVLTLEAALKVYKTSLWHEKKLKEIADLERVVPKNTKEAHAKKKLIEETERIYRKKIESAEKYNCETLNAITKSKDKYLLDFADVSTDLYSDFTRILINDALEKKSNDKSVLVIPALLRVNPNGEVEVNGTKYDILT